MVEELPVEVCGVTVRPAQGLEEAVNEPRVRGVIGRTGAVNEVLPVTACIGHAPTVKHSGVYRQW
jgi:hypothetical protein